MRSYFSIAQADGRYSIHGDGDDLGGEGVIIEGDTLAEVLAILPS